MINLEALAENNDLTQEQKQLIDSILHEIGKTYEKNKDFDKTALVFKKLSQMAKDFGLEIISFK